MEAKQTYKVFIPCADKAEQLGEHVEHKNKVFITVGYKPVISHVIEKFPEDIECVVAVGYKGEQIKEFLHFAYPKRKITFVDVDKYEGPESGAGYTLLKAKDYLQCPFIFFSSDTIIDDSIPQPNHNWMGSSRLGPQYRSIHIEGGNVAAIMNKGASKDAHAYVGVSGIYNYKEFWNAMDASDDAVKIGDVIGMQALLEKGIKPVSFSWHDTGNLDRLELAKKAFKEDDGPNILEKPSEAIWFLNGNVYKFSADKDFIKNRILRTEFLKGLVPRILDKGEFIYSYRLIDGDLVSRKPTSRMFEQLLDSLYSQFWDVQTLSLEEEKAFKRQCLAFYKDKTLKRVQAYFDRFNQIDQEEIINEQKYPKIKDIFAMVDWNLLADGRASTFHGDLHFENILRTKEGVFRLLDWRQDFCGGLRYGDLYYDLAKLYHGLIVSHDLVNRGEFIVEQEGSDITFDILRKYLLIECETALLGFCKEHNLDAEKVQMLTALIFLNIAALHHYPYSLLLFYLGKTQLYDLVKNK